MFESFITAYTQEWKTWCLIAFKDFASQVTSKHQLNTQNRQVEKYSNSQLEGPPFGSFSSKDALLNLANLKLS